MKKSLASIAIISLLSIPALYAGKGSSVSKMKSWTFGSGQRVALKVTDWNRERNAEPTHPENTKGKTKLENSFDTSKVSKMKSWKLGRERVALNAADWDLDRDAVRALAALKYYEPKKK